MASLNSQQSVGHQEYAPALMGLESGLRGSPVILDLGPVTKSDMCSLKAQK